MLNKDDIQLALDAIERLSVQCAKEEDTAGKASSPLGIRLLMTMLNGALANVAVRESFYELRQSMHVGGRNYTDIYACMCLGSLRGELASGTQFGMTEPELRYFRSPMRTNADLQKALEVWRAPGGLDANGYNIHGWAPALSEDHSGAKFELLDEDAIEQALDDDPSAVLRAIMGNLGSGAVVMGAAVNAALREYKR